MNEWSELGLRGNSTLSPYMVGGQTEDMKQHQTTTGSDHLACDTGTATPSDQQRHRLRTKGAFEAATWTEARDFSSAHGHGLGVVALQPRARVRHGAQRVAAGRGAVHHHLKQFNSDSAE